MEFFLGVGDALTLAKNMGHEPKGQWLRRSERYMCVAGKSLTVRNIFVSLLVSSFDSNADLLAYVRQCQINDIERFVSVIA